MMQSPFMICFAAGILLRLVAITSPSPQLEGDTEMRDGINIGEEAAQDMIDWFWMPSNNLQQSFSSPDKSLTG